MHPLGLVLDGRVPGFARAVQGKLAARGAAGAPGLHCEPLAEGTCGVVPGSPVVRWKWSPPRPVATQIIALHGDENESVSELTGELTFTKRR